VLEVVELTLESAASKSPKLGTGGGGGGGGKPGPPEANVGFGAGVGFDWLCASPERTCDASNTFELLLLFQVTPVV